MNIFLIILSVSANEVDDEVATIKKEKEIYNEKDHEDEKPEEKEPDKSDEELAEKGSVDAASRADSFGDTANRKIREKTAHIRLADVDPEQEDYEEKKFDAVDYRSDCPLHFEKVGNVCRRTNDYQGSNDCLDDLPIYQYKIQKKALERACDLTWPKYTSYSPNYKICPANFYRISENLCDSSIKIQNCPTRIDLSKLNDEKIKVLEKKCGIFFPSEDEKQIPNLNENCPLNFIKIGDICVPPKGSSCSSVKWNLLTYQEKTIFYINCVYE